MPRGDGVTRRSDGRPRRFEGRRAIVTGASRGIGAAVAERLGAEGASVALVARTSVPGDRIAGSLLGTADRLRRHGAEVVTVVADLTDERDRATVVDRARVGLGGPIDVLVNNAAAAMYAPLCELSLKRRRLMFEANVHAPLDLAQAVVPTMASAGEGWIVNLTSRAAQHWDGPPFELGTTGTTIAEYGASKAALDRMSNGLAAELFDRGIRVNAVAPVAAVLSEGADALVGARLRPDQIESMEHMVEAVVALCCCDLEVTGRTTTSSDVLDELAIEVRGLDGGPLGGDGPTADPGIERGQ